MDEYRDNENYSELLSDEGMLSTETETDSENYSDDDNISDIINSNLEENINNNIEENINNNIEENINNNIDENDNIRNDIIPCEICNENIRFEEYLVHTRNCYYIRNIYNNYNNLLNLEQVLGREYRNSDANIISEYTEYNDQGDNIENIPPTNVPPEEIEEENIQENLNTEIRENRINVFGEIRNVLNTLIEEVENRVIRRDNINTENLNDRSNINLPNLNINESTINNFLDNINGLNNIEENINNFPIPSNFFDNTNLSSFRTLSSENEESSISTNINPLSSEENIGRESVLSEYFLGLGENNSSIRENNIRGERNNLIFNNNRDRIIDLYELFNIPNNRFINSRPTIAERYRNININLRFVDNSDLEGIKDIKNIIKDLDKEKFEIDEKEIIECPVCYDDLRVLYNKKNEEVENDEGNEEENIIQLKCDHIFCIKCVNMWFKEKKKTTCPVCVRDFTET
jgi:hypothetical protein